MFETIFVISIIVLIIIIHYIKKLYQYISNKIDAPKQKLREELISKKYELKNLEKIISSKNIKIRHLEQGISEKDILFETLKKKDNDAISKITSLYSDFVLIQYDLSSKYLATKKHPAYKEAKRISDLKRDSKIHLEQYRQMMYKYEILLNLFPELSNYVDDFDTIKQLEDIKSINVLQENFDRVQYYVSKEEYLNLSTNDKNQLALDRYIQGQKTKWQIGRDYELFCGHLYEIQGWQVEYIGMEKKFEDMGRDLIAIKGNVHRVIQCKFWAKDKIIHEKHITQLFGTTIEYGMNKPNNLIINPVFITNISLSEKAKIFANKLGVLIYENILIDEFPRIKCNINYDEFGAKSYIYHLPFDQQYDRTKINKEGEFYAFTVKEATEAGFRRAYKYFGH